VDLPNRVNVLLIGSGGREHALAWKLRQSPRLGTLWLAEGATNVGLRGLGTPTPRGEVDLKNLFRTQRFCQRNEIQLVVIGPEGPLAAGAADGLAAPGRLVFGPVKAAARLEADKAFAKQVMRSAAIPTAEARVFDDPASATRYVQAHDAPCVVKASGLAAGKGVVVCDDAGEAIAAIERIMVRREFGDSGSTILIEERLSGPEVSVLALVDGQTFWVLDPCQDHKRIGEGDTGPNTGGMGAYCPAPILGPAQLERVQREVLVPVVNALARDGIAYRGVLYAGLMLTPAGPKVLEFNCRFGDPECQVLLPRMKCDLVEVLWATAAGSLADAAIEFDTRTSCCVVMASEGYPDTAPPAGRAGETAGARGRVITGLDQLAALAGPDEELVVFHSGTALNAKDEIVTAGGRVLSVTALARDLEAARALANAACERIAFHGSQWRRDIGRSAPRPFDAAGVS